MLDGTMVQRFNSIRHNQHTFIILKQKYIFYTVINAVLT